jgi:hypothetical protein
MAEQSSLSPPIDSYLFYTSYAVIFRKLFLACGSEVLPIRTRLIACGSMVLTIFVGRFSPGRAKNDPQKKKSTT